MSDRRAWSGWSTVEQLEVRSLLSTASAIQALSDLDRDQSSVNVAAVVASGDDLQEGYVSWARSSTSVVDDQSRSSKTSSVTDVATAPSDRSNTGTAEVGRVPRSKNTATRQYSEALQVAIRRMDSFTETQTDDSPASVLETIQSGSGIAVSDSADGPELFGGSPSSGMSFSSASGLSLSLLGSEGRRTVRASETMQPGSVMTEITEPELTVAKQNRVVLANFGRGSLLTLQAPMMSWDFDGPVLAELLEGSLHPDWDLVDRDLRQFISGLRSFAEDASGSREVSQWPLAIGVAMVLSLVHRASHNRSGLFRRRLETAFGFSPECPVPLGPWPLGPR